MLYDIVKEKESFDKNIERVDNLIKIFEKRKIKRRHRIVHELDKNEKRSQRGVFYTQEIKIDTVVLWRDSVKELVNKADEILNTNK